MDDVAGECKVTPPNNWVAATSHTAPELKRGLRQTVGELLDRVDWPDPITKDTVITGTGAEFYSLPSDFRRLTGDDEAVYETIPTRRLCISVPTNGQWTHLKQVGTGGG